MKVFLSYTRSDQEFVEHLRKKIQEWGYLPWMDIYEIMAGSHWPDEVNKGLEAADVVLGVMTPNAIASPNVKNEWDWTLVNDKRLILLHLQKCKIPMHYIRLNYIDFVSNVNEGFTKLQNELRKCASLEPSVSLAPEVRQHVEKYWKLCRQFFEISDFALAAFFAVTLLDEIGTMICLGLEHAVISSGLRKSFKPIEEQRDLTVLSKADKRELAILMALTINSRVQRLYPREGEQFALWFEEGKFPIIFEQALFMKETTIGGSVPSQVISQSDAFILICIVGEIYAEIQGYFTGTTPKEWERILTEIDEFREKYKSASIL